MSASWQAAEHHVLGSVVEPIVKRLVEDFLAVVALFCQGAGPAI